MRSFVLFIVNVINTPDLKIQTMKAKVNIPTISTLQK